MWRVLVVIMVGFLCGCSFTRPRQGGVRVVTNVPDATLYVDEELRGPARAFQESYLHLSPGTHRLILEHPEYFTEFIEVTVPESMGLAVRVEMRQRPN